MNHKKRNPAGAAALRTGCKWMRSWTRRSESHNTKTTACRNAVPRMGTVGTPGTTQVFNGLERPHNVPNHSRFGDRSRHRFIIGRAMNGGGLT